MENALIFQFGSIDVVYLLEPVNLVKRIREFSFFWIHSFKEKNPLKYIGFNGSGHQVRDALHPRDLAPLLSRQLMEPSWDAPKIINIGGGIENSMSLKQLSDWCEKRFGPNEVVSSLEQRPMDAPWIVMDSTTAQNAWNWSVKTKEQILDEIADHAEKNLIG